VGDTLARVDGNSLDNVLGGLLSNTLGEMLNDTLGKFEIGEKNGDTVGVLLGMSDEDVVGFSPGLPPTGT